MSKAKPMRPQQRRENYERDGRQVMTGRQWRRYRQKKRRLTGAPLIADELLTMPPRAKLRPTPRRADAIGIRRSKRRAREMFRAVKRDG